MQQNKSFDEALTYPSFGNRVTFTNALIYLSDKPCAVQCLNFLLKGNVLDDRFFFVYSPYDEGMRTLEALHALSPVEGLSILALLQDFVPGYAPEQLDSNGKPMAAEREQQLVVFLGSRYGFGSHHDDEDAGYDRADFFRGLIEVVSNHSVESQLSAVQRFLSLTTFVDLTAAIHNERVRERLSGLNAALENHMRKIIKKGLSAVWKETADLDLAQFDLFTNYLREHNVHINVFARDAKNHIRAAMVECFGQQDEQKRACNLQ